MRRETVQRHTVRSVLLFNSSTHLLLGLLVTSPSSCLNGMPSFVRVIVSCCSSCSCCLVPCCCSISMIYKNNYTDPPFFYPIVCHLTAHLAHLTLRTGVRAISQPSNAVSLYVFFFQTHHLLGGFLRVTSRVLLPCEHRGLCCLVF